jgi:acylphosphatase
MERVSVDKISARVIIQGWVQGVYFRAFTRDQAIALGLSGWVRNRRDGTVEAYFEGEGGQVKKMVAWCHQGSPRARVEKVEMTFGNYQGGLDGFEVRYG